MSNKSNNITNTENNNVPLCDVGPEDLSADQICTEVLAAFDLYGLDASGIHPEKAKPRVEPRERELFLTLLPYLWNVRRTPASRFYRELKLAPQWNRLIKNTTGGDRWEMTAGLRDSVSGMIIAASEHFERSMKKVRAVNEVAFINGIVEMLENTKVLGGKLITSGENDEIEYVTEMKWTNRAV